MSVAHVTDAPGKLGYDVVIAGGAMYGFSGHGLQQSPAMGRGTAERIIYGEYRSLDLSPFHYERIEHNEPLNEKVTI